jgi:hypothetical protein
MHPKPGKGGILRPCRVSADIVQDQAQIPVRIVCRDVSDSPHVGVRIEPWDFPSVVCIRPCAPAWPARRIDHDGEVEGWVAVDSVKACQLRVI